MTVVPPDVDDGVAARLRPDGREGIGPGAVDGGRVVARLAQTPGVGHDHRFTKGCRELECPAVRGVDVGERHHIGGGEEGGDLFLRDEAQVPGDRQPIPAGALHPLADIVKRPAGHQPDQVVALGPRRPDGLQEEIEAFIPTDEPEEQRDATAGWEVKLPASGRRVRERGSQRRVHAVRHHVDARAG